MPQIVITNMYFYKFLININTIFVYSVIVEKIKKIRDNKIDLRILKYNFTEKFPDHKLAKILLDSPDELSLEELQVFARICLAILNMEGKK